MEIVNGTTFRENGEVVPVEAWSARLTGRAMERSRALVCRNLFQEPSPLLRAGRFELMRTLGSGGSGTVYEALDPLEGQRVALKILHTRSPHSLYRIKREFRSLAGTSHPNLVALHELFTEQDDAYFTMELINGCDFVTHLRKDLHAGDMPLNERPLKAAFLQLCAGIHALHQQGKLHLDIKPSNVLRRDAAARLRKSPLVRGSALLDEAGAAMLCAQPERALQRLRQAIRTLDAAEGRLTAACARYCAGTLIGSERGTGMSARRCPRSGSTRVKLVSSPNDATGTRAG